MITAGNYVLPRATEVKLGNGRRTINFPAGTVFQIQIPQPGSCTEIVSAKSVKGCRYVGASIVLPASVVALLRKDD